VAISQKLTSVDGRLPMAGTFGDTMPAAEVTVRLVGVLWDNISTLEGRLILSFRHGDIVSSFLLDQKTDRTTALNTEEIEVTISKTCADDSGLYESANEQLSAQKHKTVLVPIRKKSQTRKSLPQTKPFRCAATAA
jgi:hypothetical protein